MGFIMEPVIIKEDRISRNWLSKTILKVGLKLFQKWWLISICALFVFAILLHFLGIPLRAWIFLILFPIFPMVIAISCILIHSFYALPQTWILNHTKIKARGFRLIGTVPWRSVYDWRLEDMQGLANYYRLRFKWKKWKGIAGGKHCILVPASVPVEVVKNLFYKHCSGR